MPMISRTLAEDITGRWQLVYDAAELHLYVGFATPDSEPLPEESQTVDDFIATIPSSDLRAQARNTLIGFLETVIDEPTVVASLRSRAHQLRRGSIDMTDVKAVAATCAFHAWCDAQEDEYGFWVNIFKALP